MNLKTFLDQSLISSLKPDGVLPHVTGLAIDSRQIKPGDLFIAISGTSMNGLDFAQTAVDSGAVAILADKSDDLQQVEAIAKNTPVFVCENVRKVAALLVSSQYPSQPQHCVAVTGTNGKTSVVSFVRQLWALLGHKSASLGTLGLEVEGIENPFSKERNNLTTPDVVTLHQRLEVLKDKGVDHVAFEASSHGLDQYRLEGVRPKVAAFTNFSQDHLDYHPSMEAYFQAKLRLFTEVLDPEGIAVINMMDSKGEDVLEVCRSRGLKTLTISREGTDLEFVDSILTGTGYDIALNHKVQRYTFHLPLPGSYQVENILVAIGILVAEGFAIEDILAKCEELRPVPGRLEPAAPGVYVDYAHTPDALRSAIQAISHEPGHLWVVLGCGGDRDQEKRPLMGQVVAGPEFAGKVIVTDDNPRTEDPAAIRSDVLKGIPHAMDIGGRRRAIRAVMGLKSREDKVLIAGKGHETYQIIGTEIHDFDDREEVRKAMLLWDSKEAEDATGRRSSAEWRATGVSIDTRTLQPGDLFVALQGDHSDGHAHVEEAFRRGAVAAIVSQAVDTDKPLLMVADTLKALEALGVYARKRATKAKRIAITGSVGKTSTKEMLKLALSTQGLTHASVASYNNHWGVPLTLARMPKDTDYAIFEMGMNHPGEITPLTKMVQPHVAVITNIAASHLGHFNSVLEIAKAKAEIFQGLDKDGVAILNADNEYFPQLQEWAKDVDVSHCVSFGQNVRCEARLQDDNHQLVIDDKVLDITVVDLGFHLAQNAGAVLLAVNILGADVAEANVNLVHFQPVEGRGDVHRIVASGLEFTLINESYNANPLSMKAALQVLGTYRDARKVAVLGDMRELGKDADALHEGLLELIKVNNIDRVYCCGPHMANLYERLPSQLKAGYTESSPDLIPLIQAGLQPDDVVMVKGSLGTRMRVIVDALLSLHTNDGERAVN